MLAKLIYMVFVASTEANVGYHGCHYEERDEGHIRDLRKKR
jgi:hypothetical protein